MPTPRCPRSLSTDDPSDPCAAASVDEKICGVDLKKGDASGFFHTERQGNINERPKKE